MNSFDLAAVLVALAAALAYANHRWLRFPASIGILVIALAGSLVLLGADRLAPGFGIRAAVAGFLVRIDFSTAVMHGILCFLLFAGSLHVDWGDLKRGGWVIGTLSTLGVGLSTVVVGLLAHALFGALGLAVPLMTCLVFGALISPTDPISVLGLLKELRAPRDLEATIAGESLFNDGVGVVVFFVFLSLAGLDAAGMGGAGGGGPGAAGGGAGGLLAAAGLFVRQAGGGLLLGLGLGWLALRALKSIDHGPLELLITLALVMFMYSVSFWLGVSGPIAEVVAGLMIGNHGRRHAMSEASARHIDAFWAMTDEILNAVLFLLLGLEVVAIRWPHAVLAASLLAIPVVLLARLVSVGLPIGALGRAGGGRRPRGLVPILTWGGLRGGLCVAMVLSLPPFADRNLLLGATYAVVVFSVVVQGLTMPRLCAHYGLRREATDGRD